MAMKPRFSYARELPTTNRSPQSRAAVRHLWLDRGQELRELLINWPQGDYRAAGASVDPESRLSGPGLPVDVIERSM